MTVMVMVPRDPPYPTQYIAAGTRTVNGKSEEVYIMWTDEGGGWHQWTTGRGAAKKFKTAKAALTAAKSCPGPWYNIPADNSMRAEEVFSDKAKAYMKFIQEHGQEIKNGQAT